MLHIPFRTCVACRKKRPKLQLLRIARTPDSHIEIDTAQNRAGRGAYLCPNRKCVDFALKKKAFRSHLKAAPRQEFANTLYRFING